MKRIQAAELGGAQLKSVVDTLKTGGLVCLPTDTVYGLAVDPRNEVALDRIFELKGRPSANPILVLVDSIDMARSLALPNPWLDRLATEFWPGPLTLVAPCVDGLPGRLTAGTGAIGVRCPDQELPIRIIQAFQGPITATSANRSGEPAAQTADEAFSQLGEGIDILIDGGPATESTPSTVMDLRTHPPTLLRKGRLPESELGQYLKDALQRTVP